MQEDNRKTSGDGLDDYIQVSSPGLRIIVGALSLVLVATVVWGLTGKIPVTTTVTGCVIDSEFLSEVQAQSGDAGHYSAEEPWVVCFVDSSMYSAEQIEQFGDDVAILHSRLSLGERYDQWDLARTGQAHVVVGARSALFAPLANLGLIIIDEEHEGSYKSEKMPKYHAREVAAKRAELAQAMLVLGSATPSMESYHRAMQGTYDLYRLTKRASRDSVLAATHVVDMRRELEQGNRSIFSGLLQRLMEDRLAKQEQILLFLNRRGYNSVVSCRSCGNPIRCPHCDVALTAHIGFQLRCHYCGYAISIPKSCPSCGSPYLSGFGLGTEKVQMLIEKQFPGVRTLRMDMDTTSKKDGHQTILSQFGAGGADILIGTQMIVKGHDFPNVTLVGILAADLSLYNSDYMAAERTFQLLTQAAGRAGRGAKKGEVIIQTYSPENYAVRLGAEQNYKEFYKYELSYRKLLGYPPVINMLGILFACENETHLTQKCNEINLLIERRIRAKEAARAAQNKIQKIGPSEDVIAKINDKYRKMIYLKAEDYSDLTDIKDTIETYMEENPDKQISITFDFSMMGNRKG